jgi:hypothetical protein
MDETSQVPRKELLHVHKVKRLFSVGRLIAIAFNAS